MTFPELLAAIFFCVFTLGLVIGGIVGYFRDLEEDDDDAV